MNIMEFITQHTPFFYLIQSLWRDEAFSYFMARPHPFAVIVNTANDFNPPLYYLLLHYWMQLVGKSDVGLRFLSFLFHIATVFIMYKLARRLFSKNFSFFVAIFTFLNPMLIYYAFEMRMYAVYAFFSLCSVYFFYTKNWKWYIVTTVLGLYSHSFFPLIIFSYLVYLWIAKQLNKKTIITVMTPVVFYLPWIPVIVNQFLHSKDSWMFPVDIQLVFSVLGNLFTNYEGTPGNWWWATAILSLFISAFSLLGLRKRKQVLLFFLPAIVPLGIILSYSILKRPIYVNRYMIFVTVYEIILISLGINSFANKKIRFLSAMGWLLFIIILNIEIAHFHKKTDFKTTFFEINKLASAADYIYAKTPISFLESVYYYKNENNVSIFNPNNITIPSYIGTTVTFPNASKLTLPPAPSKTFLIGDDASYELFISK